MLHFKLRKCLLLMGDTSVYAQFDSINDCHSVSDWLESSQKRYSFIGLQHPSSAIYKLALVHARLFILQEQLRLYSKVVQRDVGSSLMPDGASLSLSNFHPFPSSEGTSWSDTSAFFSKQKLKSLLSQYDGKDILMWEEGPHSSDSSVPG